MAVYYVNLLLILGLAYPLCLRNPTKIKKAVYVLITFGYMWFLASFRVNIGYDYLAYINIFEEIKALPSLSEVFALKYEPGFELLTWFMTKFVTSPTMMYVVYSALIFVPMAIGIYLYCEDVWLSTWCFVTLAYFYSGMNFMRQNLACAVVFLGYKFLRDRKPIPYFLIVLLGASFHKTALIMIPLYFLSMLPLGKKTGIFYGAATLLTYLLSPWIVDFVTNYIFTYYKDTMYINQGFSAIFLLIPTVILGACLALFPIWKKRDPNANMLVSMMIFAWVVWLFITHHFILERLSHYPYMLAFIAVPKAISCLKASPEDQARLAELEAAHQAKKKAGKEEQYEIRQLRQKVSDHKKYYWSAVIAFLLVTWLYNEFGTFVNGTNGFHNVFPYQSVIPWLNALP